MEIVIGEDESNDGTREICVEIAQTYKDKIRLDLRSRKDVIYINGLPTGRYNFIQTIKSARGKYIALCDGDDFWTDSEKLKRQINFLEKNADVSICGHVTKVVKEDGVEYNDNQRPNPFFVNRKLSQRDIVKMITIAGPSFHTSSFVFRKSALTEFNLLSKVSVADYFLLVHLTTNSKAYVLPNVMSTYFRNKRGISYERENQLLVHSKNQIEFFKAMDGYTNAKYKELFQIKIIQGTKGLMRWFIKKRNISKSLYYFFRLILIDRALIKYAFELKRLY